CSVSPRPGQRWHAGGVRFLKWAAGGVWAGSWYLMYLEITRWHHVKPSLAFNSDLVPEFGVRPRPGLPLILLYVACVAAPLTVIAAQVRSHPATPQPGRPHRPGGGPRRDPREC